jgi:hypothetical protein
MTMKRLTILLVFFFLFTVTTPVHADVAPPEQPPGANPGPGSQTTQVRMAAESVVIDVQAKAPTGSLGQALVTADFTMHNTGSQNETMDVRFPISGNDGFENYPEISDFQASVNGSAVNTHRTTGKDPFGYDDSVPWAAFAVTFPAGQDTNIRVTYSLEASGFTPNIWYYYIFSTGAGWKESIGSVKLTVRLPYPVNPENFLGCSIAGKEMTLAGSTMTGDEISWSYTNLEPTTADNFILTMVQPSVWQNVLQDQAAVKQNPPDGEAWGMLGKLYKKLLFSAKAGFRSTSLADDKGAQELLTLSKQAYGQAVSLKPKDPLWHAGYANLLGYSAYWAALEGQNTTTDAVQAINEIRQALKLAPGDPTVDQIATEILLYFPDGMTSNGTGYDYPWLTATPTVLSETASPLLTSTPLSSQVVPATEMVTTVIPTSTPISQVEPTATATATSKPLLPICGAALLPLAAVLLVRRWHG